MTFPHASEAINYLQELNEPQYKAVTHPSGPLLVIAGAGSGKTRTIVYRVAWLVERGVDPASILLLTFTRRAAEEMINRAAHLLDKRVARVAGGTFHSTGNLILRRYGSPIGIDPSFSIMDQSDSIETIDHIRKNLEPAPPDLKKFPKARTILEILGHAAGRGGSISESLEMRYPHFVEYAPHIERLGRLYAEHKAAHNMSDYDDLLAKTIELLESGEDVRRAVSKTWRYILVDEYQDTNRLQALMLELLASEHDDVMAVGDDAQSIYSFRGADFRNIMEFPELFPGTKIIKLEENYRSTAPILALTNNIIANARSGYPKRLVSRVGDGPKPLIYRPAGEREQSQFVKQCLDELRDGGVPLSEIAVLFRAGYHSFDLEGELTRNSVPFVKRGGFKFLESAHIKDVLAHLKALSNPRDRISWARILRLLPGVGLKTSVRLAGTIAEHGLKTDPAELGVGRTKYKESLKELLDLLHALRQDTGSIAEKVDRINQYYFPYLQNTFDNYPKRIRDLEQLADLTLGYRSLNRFLNDMALEPPDADATGPDTNANSLVLSTVHSAKGLEWHTVIILWAVEGRIPSPHASSSADELEEERRLVYVATTRAKHNLVVSAPLTMLDRRTGVIPVQLSRFFTEVPEDCIRTYSPHGR